MATAPLAPADLRLDRARAAFLIVDFQERLAAAMAPGDVVLCERNILTILAAARRLEVPVVVSEQYPRGLGRTLPALRAALEEPGTKVERLEKVEFSCTDAPPFAELYGRLGRDQWIVAGMEAHICVYQTARGLLEKGARVHVPSDAVISRAPANMHVGLSLIERAGGVVTCTETVIFDLLRRAGTDEFRALSALVK
jgi:nicotinamidase-related amidase